MTELKCIWPVIVSCPGTVRKSFRALGSLPFRLGLSEPPLKTFPAVFFLCSDLFVSFFLIEWGNFYRMPFVRATFPISIYFSSYLNTSKTGNIHETHPVRSFPARDGKTWTRMSPIWEAVVFLVKEMSITRLAFVSLLISALFGTALRLLSKKNNSPLERTITKTHFAC